MRNWLLGLVLALPLTALLTDDGLAKAKPSRAPRPEPELKVLELNIRPLPYQPSNGPLEFAVTVQLPKELNGATILEVSSLISSPSKTSLRFLSHRQPVELPARTAVAAGNPTLSLRLSWDGQDHRKQQAGPGTYSYEVRVKLLAETEKGPRTMMVAWPKRGTVDVK
ncbi:hypothetical protein [Nitrospira moscoviensis]|uniref:Uncharacterized protein n=1 Tax=Nitrospira moscoviensis TaxID=42253 RepID=A0A0K2G7J4_NITMO|nr:hypothetical protein [Nitrospira moscoviensis]ALA56918.1 conserved exported protein of unknown function [Nitrospira moscoviensis]